MKLADHIRRLLNEKLEHNRIPVWYDKGGVFKGFIEGINPENAIVVDAKYMSKNKIGTANH